MAHPKVVPHFDFAHLILPPALITLAMTILRLTGEMQHWSDRWFSTETGGIVPQGVSWFFGITWLAVPIGVYFAVKLTKAYHGPDSLIKALIFAALGLIILIGFRYPIAELHLGFPKVLIPIWLSMVVAGALQYFGWPSLFKALLFYGMAARIPVAVVMFLAMAGNWRTHYDYVGLPAEFAMPLVPRFLWLAFFPQLIFWVAFTIVAGSVCGTLVTVVIRFRHAPPRTDVN